MTIDLDTIESDLARLPGGIDLVARLVHHIPALVAEVRQLEADRNERTRQHAARGVEAVAVIDELRATLANLRAEMQGYCDRLLADGRAAALERDELRATLANERGEGAGPSEGWTWDGNSSSWLHGLDANGEYPDDGWTVDQTPAGQDLGWTWEHRGTQSDPYPYARDAMRQADLARAGGAT